MELSPSANQRSKRFGTTSAIRNDITPSEHSSRSTSASCGITMSSSMSNICGIDACDACFTRSGLVGRLTYTFRKASTCSDRNTRVLRTLEDSASPTMSGTRQVQMRWREEKGIEIKSNSAQRSHIRCRQEPVRRLGSYPSFCTSPPDWHLETTRHHP